MKKTGIQLITQERNEQIHKHNIQVCDDKANNDNEQLRRGARKLLSPSPNELPPPEGWSDHIWQKMSNKSVKERLIIAGALIAAELDRINY